MVQYNLSYQLAPILLQGGIVAASQGGLAPITNYLPPNASDGTPYATFLPVPGGTLLAQSIGMYPFANIQVAANATIQQPLTISLLMIVPINQPGGYSSKRANLTQLQTTLSNHNNAGGWYVVSTPAFTYQTCLILAMGDVTAEENKQKQIEWQIDFIAPLISQAQAQAALNALMGKVNNGNQIVGTPSWSGNTNASPADQTSNVAALQAFSGVS
jgi:hypothetical protein